uniref:Uncharacterized protein n=1 Tax=Phytophthora fragariae TaxID=53985 RepID=A0A6A3DBL7_9STRA|nr:hypothetical protein PF009_g30917 [Phytophthora fragariae]
MLLDDDLVPGGDMLLGLVLGGDMVLDEDLLLGGDMLLGEDLFPGTATLKGASMWISAEHVKVEFLFVETTMEECRLVTKWIALRTKIPISALKMQM